MKMRKLGSELEVPEIGYGCMGLSGIYGPVEDAHSIELVRQVVDLGVGLLDSSDAYGNGHNESLLGQALQGIRNRVVLVTKFGQIRKPEGTTICGTPEYVRQACDASLKRLKVDHIDVYFQHRVDKTVPIEDTVGAMSELISRGKVRFIGICEASAKTLRRAHAEHPLTALQTEYSLWFREVEKDILPACKELGVGYIAYAPLGRGLLTGRIKSVDDIPENDRRRRHPRFFPENLAKNLKLVAELEAMAKTYGATSAQVALAWMLAQWEGVVPIPGTNNAKNVELNVAAVDLVIDPKDIARLNEIFAFGAGAGERYMAGALKGVGI